MTIRVKTHLHSETLRLPEIRPLVGKDVVIVVREQSRKGVRTAKKSQAKVSKKGWFDRNFGRGWPDEKNDGFEEALEKWRKEDRPGELPE